MPWRVNEFQPRLCSFRQIQINGVKIDREMLSKRSLIPMDLTGTTIGPTYSCCGGYEGLHFGVLLRA